MKFCCLYITLVAYLLCFTADVQNMVPNGNFEQYSSCPPSAASVILCNGWRQYHAGTSDYFACTSAFVGVPSNFAGYQWPASANAYMGCITYQAPGAGYGEYIARSMTPLTVNTPYEVSMYVSLGNVSQYATSNLGIWFYKNGPTSTLSGSAPLTVIPQIRYNKYGAIVDTAAWVHVADTFVTDSAYDNIVIGGFGNNAGAVSTGFGIYGEAYYYFDSVVIRQASRLHYSLPDTVFCIGDSIYLSFSALVPYNSTNVFLLQLSDASGSFVNATTIGTKSGGAGGVISGVIPITMVGGPNYKIRILCSNPVDSSLPSGKITINTTFPNKPVAANNGPICQGDSFKLTSSNAPAGISYKWSGPGGFTASTQNVSCYNATLNDSGNYIVTVTSNRCASKDTTKVTIKPSPVYSGGYNAPLCQNDSLKITVTSNFSFATYSWAGPNGFSSSQQNPSRPPVSFADSGFYKAIASFNGCTYTDSFKVTIKPQPQNFSASSNTPVCAGNSVNLVGSTSSTGVTWSWSGPGSYGSTSQSPSISNAQPMHSGNYILTASLNGCSIKDTEAVVVKALPPTPAPSANTPVCVGQTLDLNAGITAPGYLWDGPGSFTNTSQNPSIPNAASAHGGTYSVKSVDGNCTSPAATVNVTVIPAPNVNLYPGNTDSICQGANVTFYASSTGAGSSPLYSWYYNYSLIPGVLTNSYTTNSAADSDMYFCTVTSNGTCATPYTDTSNMVQMHVFQWLTPSVSITATPTGTIGGGGLITFTAAPVNGGTTPVYQWTRNNIPEPGATNNTWATTTLNDNDVVCVNMASTYLCPQPSTVSSNCNTVSVDVTGVKDIALNQIKIYPNPFSSQFTVSGGQFTISNIQLTDILGRVVYSSVMNSIETVVPTASLAPGIYVLKIMGSDGQIVNAKLTKE